MRSHPLESRSIPGQRAMNGPVLQSHWWRPGIAIFTLGLVALASADTIQSQEWWIPGAFILASGLLLLPEIYHVLRLGPEQIMADHLLVLAASFILYFVIGALLVPFGPRDEAEFALSAYWVGAPLGMRITAINCIGLGLAMISGSLVGQRWMSRLSGRAIGFGRSISSEWAIAAFLFIGAASSLYVLPYDIGLRPGIVSGPLRTLSMMVYVAIIVASAHRGRGSSILLGSAVVLTLAQAFLGLLMLNKSNVLLPMAALLAGLAWRLGIRRVMVPGSVVLLGVFLLIGNLVSTGRHMWGTGSRVDWSERIDVMLNGMLDRADSNKRDEYHSWARFNYIAAQGAALELYDSGQGSDDYKRVGWVFLPRFIFTDKPIITSGHEFNYKIVGYDTSSNAPGIFIDGYYNLGWWGVIIVGVAVGCILAWTSALATMVFRTRSLIWLPAAFIGSYMAFRADGTFLGDYWAIFVLLGYLVIGGWVLNRTSKNDWSSS